MSFSGFKQYLIDEEKTVFFTFGKMNPPNASHGIVLEALSKKATNNPYRVYSTTLQESANNPLNYNEKIKYLRRMFPKQSRSVIMDESIKNVYDAAVNLFNEGFRNIVMVVEDDRVRENQILLNKYNAVEGKHGFYNFKSIDVVSSENTTSRNSKLQIESAANNDFITFSHDLPKDVSDKEAKNLFNAVRTGMGLKEESKFKNHIQLKSVSDIRERFVSGEIFNVDEYVLIKETKEKALITHRGSNYLILEKEDGTTTRKWIDSVDFVDEAYEIGTDEYRDHYVKGTPGQSPKKKVAEQDAVNSAKARIEREKSTDAKKHDRMMDRARLKDTKTKNRKENFDFSAFIEEIENLTKNEGKRDD